MTKATEYNCFHCGFVSKRKWNLENHIQHRHINKNVKPKLVFYCYHCKFSTKTKWNLLRHLGTHENNKQKKLVVIKCFLCHFCGDSRSEIMDHYNAIHELNMTATAIDFPTLQEFFDWKNRLEKEETSKYIKLRADSNLKNCKKMYFRCHRDGFFSSKSSGKRHLKRLGSNKINGCCPAQITATVNPAGSVRVDFVGTHVGHVHDLSRINLTKKERASIASQLANKVPFTKILDEFRTPVKNNTDNLQRIHLVNRKDLNNILNEFNLKKEAVRRSSEWVTGDNWAEEMNEPNFIRFHKPQGTILASHPELAESDFVLIIANEIQLEMLKKFGGDCICLDGMQGHKSIHQDLELTTLLVLNDLRQGFPCVFLLSNRTEEVIMSLLAAVVRDLVGCPIYCNVFMSDVADVYYNGWCSVMPTPQYHLFCSWHVDRSWRNNLWRIKSLENKRLVYKLLVNVMRANDETTFPDVFNSALKKMSDDEETRQFSDYFRNNYSSNVMSWAFCYRKHCGLSTNVHLESMHKALKHAYSEGKKVKRIDTSIQALMKFTRDKLEDRKPLPNKGKMSTKLASIRQRHSASLQMTDAIIQEAGGGWTVGSSTSSTTYNVVRLLNDCDCPMRCHDCEICVHSYVCTCPDSSVKWNLCRHIHLIATQVKAIPEPQCETIVEEDPSTDDMELATVESNEWALEEYLIFQEPAPKKLVPIEDARERFMKIVDDILKFCTTSSEIEVAINALTPVIPSLEASRKGHW